MALPTRVHRSVGYDWPDPHRDFESMLSRFFGGQAEGMGSDFGMYPVDIREDAEHLYIEAELPGFRKEDIDVTFENQTLTISAERREDRGSGEARKGDGNGGKKGDVLLHERRYTRFLRSFTLPPSVSAQKVDAHLQEGILTVTLDKREEAKPRKIEGS